MLKLTSPSFKHSSRLPATFTCHGDNVNPELHIASIPKGTKSLALIVDDPDAPKGMWVHWLVWDIAPSTTKIKENSEPKGVQGLTDFRQTGYGGPCPPSGTHRYFFKIYALDCKLDLPEKSTKKEVVAAMQGHILDQAELIGLYGKE